MQETTQICVGLDNKPGQLAVLCGLLPNAKVNIEALCVTDDADCVWVNIVTSPPELAEQVLTDKGYRFFTEKVLVLKIPNEPGELEGVANKLAESNVNINYVYGAGVAGSQCELVLSVADPARAREALANGNHCKASSG